MRSWARIGRVDRALLALGLALWGVCFALHLQRLAAGRVAWVPFSVTPAATPSGHPRVAALWDAPPPTDLRRGDLLLRIGSLDLRGAGRFEVMAAALESSDAGLRVPVAFEREGSLRQGSVELLRQGALWRIPFASALLTLLGALLLFRAPNARASRFSFLAMLSYSLNWALFTGGSTLQTASAVAISATAGALIWPATLRALREMPEDLPPARGWRALWPWLIFPVSVLALLSFVIGAPLSPSAGERMGSTLNALGAAAAIAVATRGYRRSGAVGRRQLRWALFGIVIGLVAPLVAVGVTILRPELRWLYDASQIGVFAIPVGIVIAIARYNLYDIDRLISATATYSLLGFVLLVAMLTAIPWLAGSISAAVGVDPAGAQLGLSVALAALLVPLQQRVRPVIEQLFFAERHALAQGIAQLLEELARAGDASELLSIAGAKLDKLLRPETLAIYARSGEEFALAFSRGGTRAVPGFAGGTAFIASLAGHARPFDADALGIPLGDFERAALESLANPVLVPVRRAGSLVAFACVGPKRSGDIYTATDRALLGAVADRVSAELQRFELERLAGDSRRLQESLQSYVPRAVVDQLARGEIESGEREVSVLFVDIRGYSSYAEGARTEEVFGTVSSYTEAVSALIREHGGSVVDFSGDGLMAVFGAPRPLPEKERRAVAAARAIVDAVSRIAPPSGQGLSVGVGVATGPAFVGNVRSADRLIWAVLGRTTNLAARLQALTRERGAALIVDAPTAERAGDLARDLERHGQVRIRGHREPCDLFALPLATA